MTDLEKDKILLLAHSIGKMARELQSIKRLLEEIADTPQTEAVVKPYKPTNREILDAIENSDCPWK